MWLGCHAPRSKLARVETIWVMVTDSTVDSGGTSACLPHQILRSPSHRLLADGLSQHGSGQVRDEMSLGGLPASLPGRLTESTGWSEDRIWPGRGWIHSWQSSWFGSP